MKLTAVLVALLFSTNVLVASSPSKRLFSRATDDHLVLTSLEKAANRLYLNNYDNYMLATEWIASVCRVKTCNPSIPTQTTFFNVHGLWPNLLEKPSSSPQSCSVIPLVMSSLPADLQSMLWTRWNSLYNEQTGFLTHEWEKHGTCWNPVLPQSMIDGIPSDLKPSVVKFISDYQAGLRLSEDYLRLTLMLAAKYNPFAILTAGGVKPNNSNTVTVGDIIQVYKQSLGISKMSIICSKSRDGLSLLTEIRVCLSLNYNPIDCGSLIITGCAQSIVFPASF